MNQTTFYFKYDGTTDAIKNHRIDAKQLAQALNHVSDLIHDANKVINGAEAEEISIYTNAKFVPGSFGVELLVSQDLTAAKDVLQMLGLVAGAAGGTLLAFLKDAKGSKVKEEVIIDKRTGEVELTLDDGTKHRASSDIAELAKAPAVRRHINALIHDQLQRNGITKFALSEVEDFSNTILAVENNEVNYFKTPSLKSMSDTDSVTSTATIEFINANKKSGKSGWKISHLGEEVPVKIKDDTFIETIKKHDAPSIFGLKYTVELRVVTRKSAGLPDKKTYYIDQVIGRKRI